MKKFLKIICVSSIFLFTLLIQNVDAATTYKNIIVPWEMNSNQVFSYEGLRVFYSGLYYRTYPERANLDIKLEKEIKFIKENGNVIGGTAFDLNVGKKVTLQNKPISGTWKWDGATRNLGNYYTAKSTREQATLRVKWGYITNFAGSPAESNDIEITSANPNIVSCTNSGCTALKEGTATIKVKFKDSPKNEYEFTSNYPTYRCQDSRISECGPIGIIVNSKGDPFYGDNSGYGKIKVASAIRRVDSGADGDQRTIAYSLPDITYTVTVPPVPNVPQTSSCTGVSAITHNSATVSWSYNDTDTDPQTNYRVVIATNSNFTNNSIVKNITKPNNTNANIRSLNVTGLNPNTQYYARIQTYNEVNGWSEFSGCSGGFRTLNQPVNGVCSTTTVDACNPGIYENRADSNTQHLWTCKGSNGGTDQQCAINKPPCSVRFEKNATNATGSTGPQSFYPGETKNLVANGFQRSGHTFGGWTVYSNGTGTSFTNQQSYAMPASCSDRTLYAKWTANQTYPRTLSFDANGGTGTMNPVSCNAVGQNSACNVVVPANNGFTKSGHQFSHWTINDQRDETYVNGATLSIAQNYTMVAQWTANQTYPRTLSFLPGGGTGTMNSITCNATASNGTCDVTIPPNGFIPPTGKQFSNWTLNPGNTPGYQSGQKLSIGQNYTLTANWNQNQTYPRTLSFLPGGGTGTMNSITCNATASNGTCDVTIPPNGFIPPTGKQFSNWTLNPGNTPGYQSGQKLSIGQNYTLTANWNLVQANRAPNRPSIDGPITGGLNTSHQFTIRATDPDSDVVGYGVDWDKNGTIDDWYPVNAPYRVASGIPQIARRTWNTTGAKTFQVIAKDKYDGDPTALWSGWTQHTITISDEEEWLEEILMCTPDGDPEPQCTVSLENRKLFPKIATYEITGAPAGSRFVFMDGSRYVGESTNPIYRYTYDNVLVGVVIDSVRIQGKTIMCPTVLDCDRQENEVCGPGNTIRKKYTYDLICRETVTEESCDGGDDPGGELFFDPNIVDEGEHCGFHLKDIKNATKCWLESNRPATLLPFPAPGLMANGLPMFKQPVGRYTLWCTGTNGEDKQLNTASCYSNSDIRED